MNSIAEMGLHAQPKTKPANCLKHGAYVSRCYIGSIWSKCPACEAERIEAERIEAEAKDREARQQEWQRKIGEAGIPVRFRNRSLQSYVAESEEQTRALAFAIDYADRFDDVLATGRSALFVGKPGTGKSHLAVGIGLRIMHRDKRTVLYTTVMRAIRRVKDTWSRDSRESESEAIAALVFPDLLILDEVGVQFGSDTEKLILFDVLNERYERRKPTLLLSNLPTEEVRDYLGERVFDRLREDGGEVVVFDWQSWRSRPSSACGA
jgi:DNA replication protein DnaC